MPTDREYAIMLLQANGWSREDAEGFYDIIINRIKVADVGVEERVARKLPPAIAKGFWCQCNPETQRIVETEGVKFCEHCVLMIRAEVSV